jgi:hypothetical protein
LHNPAGSPGGVSFCAMLGLDDDFLPLGIGDDPAAEGKQGSPLRFHVLVLQEARQVFDLLQQLDCDGDGIQVAAEDAGVFDPNRAPRSLPRNMWHSVDVKLD